MVMSMFLHERIQQKLDEKHLRQADIARATGKSTAAVTKWLRGENVPKTESLKQIAELLDTTDEWLLNGDNSSIASVKIPQFAEVHDWDSDTPVDDDEVPIVFYRDFRLACGHGLDNVIVQAETRRLRMSKVTLHRRGITASQAFAAVAEDSSMSPTIYDGDTIFVDTGRNHIKDGKIFAIEHGGLFRIKRLYKRPNGGVRICSDNADEFPEELLTAQDIQEQGFRVIGWVFSVQRLETW